MTWIDERLGERRAAEEKETLIYNKASQLHGEVWNEICMQIDEAKRKNEEFQGIFRNDSGSQPEFLFPTKITQGQSSSQPKKLSLSLMADHSQLKGGDVAFSFDVEGDSVVLKRGGKTVTVAEAAMLILDPLLFPDLERIDPRTPREIWKKLGAS